MVAARRPRVAAEHDGLLHTELARSLAAFVVVVALVRARAIAEAVNVHAVAQLRGEGDRVHPRGEHHLAAHLAEVSAAPLLRLG